MAVLIQDLFGAEQRLTPDERWVVVGPVSPERSKRARERRGWKFCSSTR